MEDKLSSSIAELKKEVNSAQEKTSQELASKINQSSYTFKKKGREEQYNFNAAIQETISSAQKKLEKASKDPADKAAINKAADLLQQSTETIGKWQKLIKVADRSEFCWATVRHHEANPLALDSDNEKSLLRAEKEGRRDAEKAKANGKHRQGGSSWTNSRKRRANAQPYARWDAAGPSYRREGQVANPPPLMSTQRVNRPVKVLGPCFHCGAFGHLVATCPAKVKPYPLLYQLVVSSADDVYKVKVSVNGSPSVIETGKVSGVTAESEVTQSDAGISNNQKFVLKKMLVFLIIRSFVLKKVLMGYPV